MVKHIILWTLKDGLSEEEKATIKASIKKVWNLCSAWFRDLWI